MHYIRAGATVAIFTRVDDGIPATDRTVYLHRDHLGSVELITDATGLAAERGSGPVRARGKRVGLINMNGRVYDPEIGRFLSADPFVQAPEVLQAFNRYAYVLNNPLSFTDPSGFFFKKLFKRLVGIAKNALTFWVHPDPKVKGQALRAHFRDPLVRMGLQMVASVFIGIYAPYALPAFAGFTAYLNGGDLGDVLTAAGISGATMLAFHGVGTGFEKLAAKFGSSFALHVAKSAAHGVVGGVSSKLQGGSFKAGFMAAGFAQFASIAIEGLIPKEYFSNGAVAARTTIAAAIGGVSAELGGRKFVNGAVTGAFGRLFNHEVENLRLGNQIHRIFGESLGARFGKTNVRLETSFSWGEFRFRTDVILYDVDVFELKSHTYQYTESPSKYSSALNKVLNTYVPGLNAKFGTNHYRPGDFRNYATNGNLYTLVVTIPTARRVDAIHFFADPHRRNSGLVFYRALHGGGPH